MTRIAYTLRGGIAENIRYVRGDYVLAPDELETFGDNLPDANSLSDVSAITARNRVEMLRLKRHMAIEALRSKTDDEMLALALNDPSAPQAVKDYKAVL